MEENKANELGKLFHIDKISSKKSLKVEDRIQNRTNQFLNNQDADGLKNNRSDLNEASRKEIKNNRFANNRNYEGNDQSETAKIKIASTKNTEHTIIILGIELVK